MAVDNPILPCCRKLQCSFCGYQVCHDPESDIVMNLFVTPMLKSMHKSINTFLYLGLKPL